ncbi:MAG: hypothetical protein WCQ45_04470 [bacterium]
MNEEVVRCDVGRVIEQKHVHIRIEGVQKLRLRLFVAKMLFWVAVKAGGFGSFSFDLSDAPKVYKPRRVRCR